MLLNKPQNVAKSPHLLPLPMFNTCSPPPFHPRSHLAATLTAIIAAPSPPLSQPTHRHRRDLEHHHCCTLCAPLLPLSRPLRHGIAGRGGCGVRRWNQQSQTSVLHQARHHQQEQHGCAAARWRDVILTGAGEA